MKRLIFLSIFLSIVLSPLIGDYYSYKKEAGGIFMGTMAGNWSTNTKDGEMFINTRAGGMSMVIIDGEKLTLKKRNLLFTHKE